MSEPVHDYYATRIVQDLEDDLYDSKERIQRLRRQNDQLTAENERLRDGVEQQITHLEALLAAAEVTEHYGFAGPIQARVTELSELLNGDTE